MGYFNNRNDSEMSFRERLHYWFGGNYYEKASGCTWVYGRGRLYGWLHTFLFRVRRAVVLQYYEFLIWRLNNYRNWIWQIYANLAGALVLYAIVLMLIFGGEFHLEINWESWGELMDKFR